MKKLFAIVVIVIMIAILALLEEVSIEFASLIASFVGLIGFGIIITYKILESDDNDKD